MWLATFSRNGINLRYRSHYIILYNKKIGNLIHRTWDRGRKISRTLNSWRIKGWGSDHASGPTRLRNSESEEWDDCYDGGKGWKRKGSCKSVRTVQTWNEVQDKGKDDEKFTSVGGLRNEDLDWGGLSIWRKWFRRGKKCLGFRWRHISSYGSDQIIH